MLLVTTEGEQFCVARRGDVAVIMPNNGDDHRTVKIVLAEGRAYSILSLQEFCELIGEVRTEINRHHRDQYEATMTTEPPDRNPWEG